MMDFGSGGGSVERSDITKKRRARFLNERINQYNDLARGTKDVRKCVMRSVVTCWKRGDEDMTEWHEGIGDEFFAHTDFYEEEFARTQRELRKLIDSSDL